MSRRLGITLTDQVVSSASNFLVVLAVARVADIDEFGAFSLAYLVYQVALGVLRAGAGDVLLIRSAEADGARTADPRQALGFVLLAAVPVALLTGLAGLLAGGPMRGPLLAIAIVLVPCLLQDGYRYVLFARSRPRGAVLIDAIWLTAQLAGFALAAVGALPETGQALVLIWGAGAALSCLGGAALTETLPRPGALAWVREGRGQVGGLMADFMLLTGTSYLGFALVPLVAGLSTVAALRGAQFLFNPFVALLAGIRIVALPALTRRLADRASPFHSLALRMGAALSAAFVAYAAVVLLLPDSAGEQLLGESWQPVSEILPWIALAFLARTVVYPATESVRVLGDARSLLVTRAAASAVTVACLVVGAALGGATGGAIGMCAAFWGAGMFWFVALRVSLARRAAEPDVPLSAPSTTAP